METDWIRSGARGSALSMWRQTSNFPRIKFEFGVARTWESVARLYCTSLKVGTRFATGKGVGLESFSNLLRIQEEYFEGLITTGRDDLGIFSKLNRKFRDERSSEVASVDDLDESGWPSG